LTRRYRVAFAPEARAQLVSIYTYISAAAGADRAFAFTNALIRYCESLRRFPRRGTRRDDIRPGLRTVGFRRRVTIAFAVNLSTVAIVGVFYAGKNVEADLRKTRMS
jgi:toxin ParE1/3/4